MLASMANAAGDFDVAGVAANVRQALALLDGGLAIDVIVLDLHMPGMDGLTALPMLIERSGGARVLIVSGEAGEGAAATVKALTLGAADTLLKPAASAFAGRFAGELVERLRRIVARQQDTATAGLSMPTPRRDPVRCLAIGASTGGPHALSAFLSALDPRFAAPILVTQHLPPSFIPLFATQLRDMTGRSAAVAADGARISPGAVLVAPGDAHLRVALQDGAVVVRLDRSAAPSGCRPSVDPMLESVAAVFGAGAVGVVLSGMGRDGAIGAGKLAAAGGEVLAQDAATSVVWGMPGTVAAAGIVRLIAPPAVLARHLQTTRAPV